jgi:hypothetical protein
MGDFFNKNAINKLMNLGFVLYALTQCNTGIGYEVYKRVHVCTD